MKSIIEDFSLRHEFSGYDRSSIPVDFVLSEFKESLTDNINEDFVSFHSSLVARYDIDASLYAETIKKRHGDCQKLFDGYATRLVRCDVLDESSCNIRWNVTFIPSGSTWLYNLAKSVGWEIRTKSPDPSSVALFSWRPVFSLCQRAFETGSVTLPIVLIEGSTRLFLSRTGLLISETVDLIEEADNERLQNRRVAQELASWLDVSRRPKNIDREEWASQVRQRILSNVRGAGALDIDQNEDGSEGVIALLIFGVVSAVAVLLSFELLTLPEIIGGARRLSEECENGELLEFGSGYLNECLGL
mmetsp:Transcript_20380/g.46030  ORF Transcript_20380/g.46030 Transcript_20380/m.46030 type:complete len:303 (-) Transcript_20380:31-939(-)